MSKAKTARRKRQETKMREDSQAADAETYVSAAVADAYYSAIGSHAVEDAALRRAAQRQQQGRQRLHDSPDICPLIQPTQRPSGRLENRNGKVHAFD